MGKLFDRVYFSDNGLVQFQSVSQNEQFLFPTPFPNGFRGNESLALLAVFWDDVDLTLGEGKLFFQEYHTLNMSDIYSQIVFNRTAEDVTLYEENHNKAPFTPAWILKITWDHVMAVSYQKINNSETNTFQCILTTDGQRSFALIHFGEMRWGPGQRIHHDALTGYTDDEDLLPFQRCCIQAALCHLYLAKRPLDRCQGYGWLKPDSSVPAAKATQGIGMVYGSLHFITFDGTDYSFKALGQFVIMRLSSYTGSNTFTLQGETGQLVTHGQARQVPTMVRMAAFHQGIGKVEWQCAESGDGLKVLVDDIEVPVSVGVVHMGKEGFAVRCTLVSRCAAVYAGGLHVTVMRVAGGGCQQAALVEVPQTFYNRTVGLLGLWSSNRTDDFLQCNGKLLVPPKNNSLSEESLHLFGLSWAVPGPESLLFSTAHSDSFTPVSTNELMSTSPAVLDQLTKTCQGSLHCVHDILASNNTDLGLQSLKSQELYQNLATLFGNLPPIVTEPTVIRCKVNATLNVTISAEDANLDPISFSLLLPRPPKASIGKSDGILTWTPLDIQPVYLTIRVTDQLSSSQFTPILQVCNCFNGGTCQYNTIVDNNLQGKFQVVGCLCPKGFSGKFCGSTTDVCKGMPCFPGVQCQSLPQFQGETNQFTCGECPLPTVSKNKPGYKCFVNDFCLPPFPFPCHMMATCLSSGYSYTCKCMPGFTGDGRNCTDINECLDPATCPNAKYECVNLPGSVQCTCRYQSTDDNDDCGDSANPPGFNVFNVSLGWNSRLSGEEGVKKMVRILSMGFQNKFYNAWMVKQMQGSGLEEYRINMSSDTPHWYIKDYLNRVSTYHDIRTAEVIDLDECLSNQTVCRHPSICANTYGWYKCVCSGMSEEDNTESCIFEKGAGNRTVSDKTKDKTSLIVGLVLGIVVPLLFLLAALAYFCCSPKPIIIPHQSAEQDPPPPFNYSDPSLHYKVHVSPRLIDNLPPRKCQNARFHHA
uniref:Si:ch73-105b23.6 n=1 Tax=Esox lucius TaxID=8010 RepID=A0AAY5K0T8_ESOLU